MRRDGPIVTSVIKTVILFVTGKRYSQNDDLVMFG